MGGRVVSGTRDHINGEKAATLQKFPIFYKFQKVVLPNYFLRDGGFQCSLIANSSVDQKFNFVLKKEKEFGL